MVGVGVVVVDVADVEAVPIVDQLLLMLCMFSVTFSRRRCLFNIGWARSRRWQARECELGIAIKIGVYPVLGVKFLHDSKSIYMDIYAFL